MYAIRRIKDGFRMHKYESDEGKVDQLIKQAEHDYEVIQRQVMYLEGTEQTGVISQQSSHTVDAGHGFAWWHSHC